MFDYLHGTLIDSTPHFLVLDVAGVGYRLHIPVSSFEKLPQSGKELKVFVSQIIREDSHRLFGFLSREDREVFELLIEISGIGPRIAISILGHMSLTDLQLAVEHANVKALSQVPGIGKKMAERLVLELKDKFGKSVKGNISLTEQGVVADAINALIHLGYNPLDAQKAVKAVLPKGENPPLPELISLALKAKK